MKSKINFRDQSWNRSPAKCWILFHKHHARIFIEDSGKPKHPKNVKSINNTMGFHLVNCRVTPWAATMKS